MKNELCLLDQMVTQTLCTPKNKKIQIDAQKLEQEKNRIKGVWIYHIAQPEIHLRRYIQTQQITLVRLAKELQVAALRAYPDNTWRNEDLTTIHPMFLPITETIEELEYLLETYYKKYVDKNLRMPVICLTKFIQQIQFSLPGVEHAMKKIGLNPDAISIILEPIKKVAYSSEANQRIAIANVSLIRVTLHDLQDLTESISNPLDFASLLVNRLCRNNFNTINMLSACQLLLNETFSDLLNTPSLLKYHLEDLYEHYYNMKTGKHIYYERAVRPLSKQIAEWLKHKLALQEITQSTNNVSDLVGSSAGSKLKTNVTSRLIGLIIYLSFDAGVFPEYESKKNVVAHFNRHFIAKGKQTSDEQSFKYLYNAATTPKLETARQLRKDLKIINESNDRLIAALQLKSHSK